MTLTLTILIWLTIAVVALCMLAVGISGARAHTTIKAAPLAPALLPVVKVGFIVVALLLFALILVGTVLA